MATKNALWVKLSAIANKKKDRTYPTVDSSINYFWIKFLILSTFSSIKAKGNEREKFLFVLTKKKSSHMRRQKTLAKFSRYRKYKNSCEVNETHELKREGFELFMKKNQKKQQGRKSNLWFLHLFHQAVTHKLILCKILIKFLIKFLRVWPLTFCTPPIDFLSIKKVRN